MIGKPDNLKVFGSKKIHRPKQSRKKSGKITYA
jgi:hypothetical protein